jgi:hypothetical protein
MPHGTSPYAARLMADEPDYYAILGLQPSADQEAVRLAFRRLARLYHPDVAGTGDLARMRQLNAAHQVLGDVERRRRYDLSHGLGDDDSRAPRTTGSETSTDPASVHGAQSSAPASASPPRATAGPFRRLAHLTADEAMTVTAVAFAQAGTLLGMGLIDGRLRVWDVVSGVTCAAVAPAERSSTGVLQEVRLSPSGTLAMAWGLSLGLCVWRADTQQLLWKTAINGPSGSLDAALLDSPARVRLAVPSAPLAVAEEDPFRWAYEGRFGTDVFVRPLVGPVDPAWAVPRRCVEVASGPGGRPPAHSGWRVHQRVLSVDGQRLLTFSTDGSDSGQRTGSLHIWETDHRPLLGGVRPRQALRIRCPPGATWYPLVATPDLTWIGIGLLARAVRLIAPATRAERTVATGPLPNDTRASLSPDGALLALARGGRLDLWRTADGSLQQQWEYAGEITALVFAPDAPHPRLAIGLSHGYADVWG